MKRGALSLQARAMVWLAQREQSRSELRRKLMRVARAAAVADKTGRAGDAEPNHDADRAVVDLAELAAEVESVLDTLQTGDLLSEQRFVDSRLRARQPRFGALRIQRELQQHGLRLDDDQLQDLRSSEWRRASELWQRRFAQTSPEPRERARQARFLAGRGFSTEVVRRVVAGELAPVEEPAD
ncbi:MAG: RecX family transcriptional regulator [Rubrivivax sp.]